MTRSNAATPAQRVWDSGRRFDDLDAPIARVGGPNVPIPFSPPLEAVAMPGATDVVAAVRQVLT